jgi:SAM-dependent methyltransferase
MPGDEDLHLWRRRLVDAYSAVRRTQKIADKLVLGHQHMYAELTQASLTQLFQILKSHYELNSNSVFVDLGCGLGKVVYLASQCRVLKSIGVEVVPEHLENARKSMKKLKAENVELIEGDIKDNLHKLDRKTHLYAFDFLFSDETMRLIYAFARKRKGLYLASFRKPAELVKQHFKFNVVQSFKGRMTHVHESHKCYVYKIK